MTDEAEEWEMTAGLALREAAKEHAAAIGKEREIARQANTRALAAEAAIKATALLSTPLLADAVEKNFAGLQCSHPYGTHRPARGADHKGEYKTSPLAAYKPRMNKLIAICLVAADQAHAAAL